MISLSIPVQLLHGVSEKDVAFMAVTIKDVAKMAGVSISTVSKYINGGNVREENVQAICEAIAALDFRVNPYARSLKTHRSRSIGILLPDMTAPFFGSVIMSLERTLRERGYHSLISCYSSNHGLERDNLRYLISTGIDGLIYIPEDLSAEEFYELTAHRNIPVVQVDRMIQGVDSDIVLVDNADVILLLKHILDPVSFPLPAAMESRPLIADV